MNKRSPLMHKLVNADCTVGEINGYVIPLSHHKPEVEVESCRQLALCDVTAINRIGFRGRHISSWLQQEHNIVAPPINHATQVQRDLLVVRLSQTEILLLEDIEDQQDSFAKLIAKTGTTPILKSYPDIYYLLRQDSHCCFVVCGKHCAQMFAKLCAVDLSTNQFPNLSVAQTSFARTNLIIIRRDLAEIPAYFLLMDSSLAEYLWECLLDAMQEFNGRVVGYNVIRESSQ